MPGGTDDHEPKSAQHRAGSQAIVNESWPLSDKAGEHARGVEDQPDPINVEVRIERADDGEEWLPGRAHRWTKSHVFVRFLDARSATGLCGFMRWTCGGADVPYAPGMTTFVLVHGGWHGAWCWEKLVPELEARGHKATAMDLPSDDPEATFETYADVVAESMRDLPSGDDVVLVGHSLAGQTVPIVAAREPVRRLVYLCALPAIPGRSLLDQLATEKMLNVGYIAGLGDADAQGRRGWADKDLARQFMYADCDDESTERAIARLRPQAQTPYPISCSLDSYPDVPTTYIVCTDDQLVKPDWSRDFVQRSLDIDLIELPGSHSPFMSRPADLASILDGLVQPGA